MAESVLFVDGVAYTEADQALFNQRLRAEGVLPEAVLGTLVPSPPGGMFIRVGPGEAMIQGFLYINTANKDVAVASNSSGSTRIDLLVLRLLRAANTCQMVVKQGTPGAGTPGLTQTVGGDWEQLVATITVTNGLAAVAAGNIADNRIYSRWPASTIDPTMATDAEVTTAAAGAVTSAAAASATAIAAITAPFCNVYGSGSQSILHNTTTPMLCNTEIEDTTGMHSTVTNTSRITANVAGVYYVGAWTSFAANATGYRSLSIVKNGATYMVAATDAGLASYGNVLSVSVPLRLAVNDYVEAQVLQNSGITLSVDISAFWAARMGA